MNPTLRIFLGLFLISVTIAVDRNKFKTCEQSSFCRRNRKIQDGITTYAVVPDTIKINANSISAHILNEKNNVLFTLDIIGLESETFRIKVNELIPLYPRYEVKEALVSEPVQKGITVEKQDENGIKIKCGSNSVSVIYKPFRVDVFDKDMLAITFNSRGLMNFEHYRNKPVPKEPEHQPENENENQEATEPAAEGEGEQVQDAEVEKEEEGMWSESYDGHFDSKPKGPSSIGMDISFVGFDHVYGIPEHADSLKLKDTTGGEPYRLYNLDVFEYELYNPMALYGSIPFMIAHSVKRSVGLYWNNAAETWIDISTSQSILSSLLSMFKSGDNLPETDTHWMSESGIIDVFVMLGPSPKDVIKQFTRLTGTSRLPPMFSIAYHQCRWNYKDEEDVKNVNDAFDQYDIPYDVLWLDIEHTDNKKYFTWDPIKFATPQTMIDNVASKGRKMVTIIDPHIKRENGFHIHSEATSKNFYIKNKDGNDYEGWCWSGSSSWIDYTNPEASEWWSSKFALDQYKGSTLNLFTWNDMNEPSVFNGPEITMHKDAKHHGGLEHRDVHNIYGMYFHESTVQGQIMRSGGNERPFVLSRAFFAGTQRSGAIWTGDNKAEWEHLKVSVPMLLSIGISGISFAGADVGGFFGNPDAELLTRWYQAGAFQPFFRAHAHLDTKRREPWLFDKKTTTLIRAAIIRRYELLPYWYTLHHEASVTGLPVMRPLWLEYPTDPNSFHIDDQYLIGQDLLVKPVSSAGQTTCSVYFPGEPSESWYDVETYQKYDAAGEIFVDSPLEKIPVFQRGGSIIPYKLRVRRASSLMHRDPYTLVIAVNSTNEASGELYIDDGHSLDYKDKKYNSMKFQFTGQSLVKWNTHENFHTSAWLERVIVVGYEHSFKKAVVMVKDRMEPLELSYDAEKHVTTIRKPNVTITSNFSILLS